MVRVLEYRVFVLADRGITGTIVNDTEMGEVIQLQGDQRKDVQEFLVDKKEGLELDSKTIKVRIFLSLLQNRIFHLSLMFPANTSLSRSTASKPFTAPPSARPSTGASALLDHSALLIRVQQHSKEAEQDRSRDCVSRI